jgi:hypothetical protein
LKDLFDKIETMTALPQAPDKGVRTLRWLPFVAALAAITTAAPFAWDKDFGTFLLLIFVYLPVLVGLHRALHLGGPREGITPGAFDRHLARGDARADRRDVLGRPAREG